MPINNDASPIKRKVGVDDFGKVRVEMHIIIKTSNPTFAESYKIRFPEIIVFIV